MKNNFLKILIILTIALLGVFAIISSCFSNILRAEGQAGKAWKKKS